MWIGKIKLPQELINAQADKKLVIFTGAGVSMGSPSNLPNFEGLVYKIISDTGNLMTWESDKENPDHYLGRLEENGTEVHKLIFDWFKNQYVEPTRLHYALLSLFNSPQDVRIVTTNFDTNFTEAATKHFGCKFPIYRAPALPLGNRFNGIIYLHGCVDQKPEELIVTDKDFGRAYLTEGWATRFLVEIFNNYKVLFVGYSHNDLPMEYLGRGLPPETKRFALIPEDEIEKWKFKGIELLPYPHSKEDHDHNGLIESVESWAYKIKMGLVEHEQRIKDMVQSPPPLDREQSDYIEEVIKDPIRVRIFTKYAESSEWLHWVEKNGALKPLFSFSNPSDEISQAFAKWFIGKYICFYPEDALAVVQSQGQVLSPMLWEDISTELCYFNPLPQPEILARWVSVLLSSSNRPPDRGESLNNLLQKLCGIEYGTIAITIFKYLTTPYLFLEQSFAPSVENEQNSKKINFKVTIPADIYVFHETWKNFFKPHLNTFVHDLEPIITDQLKYAHHLLCNVGCANDKLDPVSLMRAAIEPHEQNQNNYSLYLLIDFARDIIEFLLSNEPGRAQIIIQEWILSNTPILKRLAIYGVNINSDCSPNEKIQWLLTNNCLYDCQLKHEVFQLLKVAYPLADEAVRLSLLQNVEKYLESEKCTVEDPHAIEVTNYEVYNLLYWLVQAAPNCPLARQKFNEIQAQNPKFQPREHPDLDWYSSVEWVGAQSPITVDELLSKPVSEIMEFLLTYQGEDFLGPNRDGLLSTVREAVARSFPWSLELIEELELRKEWNTDLWDAVINGWQVAGLNEIELDKILKFWDHHKEVWQYQNKIAELLRKSVEVSKDGLSSSLLSHAEAFIDHVWQESEDYDKNIADNNDNGWYMMAINSTGGTIAQFWILALSKKQGENVNDWHGIPDEYKTRFEFIISGESNAAAMGRIILASQLHFLFALDRNWVKEKMLPLLNWDIDSLRAAQAWEGYLFFSSWNEALLSDLLPLYEQAYRRLPSESAEYDQLCTHLASIAVRSSVDPISSGWLNKFINNVDENTRIKWATKVIYQLGKLNSEAAQVVWNKWIKKYWKQRINGIPLPLSAPEAGVMIDLVFKLQPVFSEVVDLVVSGPTPVLQNTNIYFRLVDKKIAEKYPQDTFRLLVHLLEGENYPFYHCDELIKLLNIISGKLHPSDVKPLKEQLIRLGCFPINEYDG